MPQPAPAHDALLPPLVLASLVACVAGAAALANCALVAALLKHITNGLYSIIIQLAVADFILLVSSVGPELWSCTVRTWDFGSTACAAYRGFNIFASTTSLYLVATIALHTLATVNIAQRTTAPRTTAGDGQDDEIKSSRHSLVANSDSSTPPRTMNIDYRLSSAKVPVTPPCIFVWILSASLSIPEFTLATTFQAQGGTVVCTLVDYTHRFNVYSLLAFLNLFLPVSIMAIASALIISKLRSTHKLRALNSYELIAALKLSLCLIIVYGVLCVPRSIVRFYELFSGNDDKGSGQPNHKAYGDMVTAAVVLGTSCAYLIATLMRPILCIILLPRLRRIFFFGKLSAVID